MRPLFACALLLLANACGATQSQPDGDGARCVGQLAPVPAADLAPAPDVFVVLPDTQFYACAYPRIFERQTAFIAEQHAELGIGLVLHTGDIVDTDVASQWQVAAVALHRLDGLVPYVLVPGNHDLDRARRSLMPAYFTLDDFGSAGGAELCSPSAGALDNTSAIVRLRGEPWLFVGLEFAPRDATLDWASGVLAEHPDLPAVLFTHAHLYDDAQRYDRAIVPRQRYHPDDYGVTPLEGIGDGQDVWEHLVEPHRNVRLVLSGHVIPDGVARSRSLRADGSVVHEVLANYQTCDRCPCAEMEGGAGFLRIFRVTEQRTLSVTTYSPHRDQFLVDPDNQFELEF